MRGTRTQSKASRSKRRGKSGHPYKRKPLEVLRKTDKKRFIIQTKVESQDKTERTKRIIILDGSNLACGYTCSHIFSVKGLKLAMRHFEEMEHEIITVIPQKRLQENETDDPKAILELHEEKKLTITPCKNLPDNKSCSYDDRFILEIAAQLDGCVISNDNYSDLVADFKEIINSRVIGFTWVDDLLFLPHDPYGRNGPQLDDILYKKVK